MSRESQETIWKARERREIAAALAWNNAQSVMPEEWHEAMDSAIEIALNPDSFARNVVRSDLVLEPDGAQ